MNFKKLSKEKNLKHFISIKKDGNISKIIGKDFNENLKKLSQKNFIKKENIFFAKQIHGDKIKIISEKDLGKKISCDSLITKEKNICLGILVADCLPIICFDKKKKILALVHAGWKGTFLKILEKTLEKMKKDFGSLEKNIFVGIGPGISQNNFEVGKEFLEKFDEKLFLKKDGKYFLDLKKENYLQAKTFGILENNFEDLEICTFENKNFFSYRKTFGKCGRFGIFGEII